MPEHDESRRDSSIIKSSNRRLTTDMYAAHEESLKTEVPIPALVRLLKELVPDKAKALDTKLSKYEAKQLGGPAAYTLLKMDVGNEPMMTAFEKLAPGFDRVHVRPSLYPHPIVV